MNNYTILHCHSMDSSAFTTLDSVDRYSNYIKFAKENNMKALAFSEHGNFFHWLSKKREIEKNGMKYIHAVEMYVTESIDEKVRDNYHVVLIALNYDGFKELNKMCSHLVAFNREDGHVYYQPRITYDELKSLSDNVAMTTACLGGILYSAPKHMKLDFIDFLSKNTHRCFLEIQHHSVKEQSDYNKFLYDLSKKYNIKLVAGTDTHASSNRYALGRELLQKRKNIKFDNESGWDLTLKTYDELVECYKKQNSLPMEIVLEAIENTNLIADMVEEFKVDDSNKYPKLYENSIEVFDEKIKSGLKERVVPRIDSENINIKEYLDRINYERKVMFRNGSTDYILLEELVKRKMRERGVYCGYNRGSSSGSLICYLMRITDVDSIKYEMNFERFMNPERVSLCDIDSDWGGSDRDKVKDFLYNELEGVYTSEIVTFNTIALKGAIKDVFGAIEKMDDKELIKFNIDKSCKMSYQDVNRMTSEIEFKEDYYRKLYPSAFEYIDMLNGVITSIGSHPAGTIVSPIPIDENIGTFTLGSNKYCVSQLNMKEVDSLNFVKLDILGLDNIGIINNTCKYVGIPRIEPDDIDFEDDKVWEHMMTHPLQIFQFEGDFAFSYLKDVFNEKNISIMREKSSKFNRIKFMGVANGAIRPAGESYRDALSRCEFSDNGHEALNDFLSDTMGYLVFQEQLIFFLNKFCGFTMGEADTVRRGFAKKTGTEQFIPKIKDGFIKTMNEKYGTSNEEAERIIEHFLVIIIDASDYLFSDLHSTPYSMIGYVNAYLRYYYPLEFLTAVLNNYSNDLDKTNETMQYIESMTDITVKNPRFRKSESVYSFDRETKTIYKGLSSIKNMSNVAGEFLDSIKSQQFSSFLDVLQALKQSPINQTQIQILIKLDYFKEFGESQKLLDIYNMFEWIDKKQISKEKENPTPFSLELIQKYSNETEKQYRNIDFAQIISESVEYIPNVSISVEDKIIAQKKYLGYLDKSQFEENDIDSNYIIVLYCNKQYTPKLKVKSISGKVFEFKAEKKKFNYNIDDGSLIYCNNISVKPAKIKNDTTGKYEFSKTKKELWLEDYRIVEI